MTSLLVPACYSPCNRQVVRTQFEAGNWSGRFGAVAAARTLLVHHPTVFDGGQGEDEGGENGIPRLIEVVVPLVASAVSHKRSVVQTNGLRCLAELFRCVRVEALC